MSARPHWRTAHARSTLARSGVDRLGWPPPSRGPAAASVARLAGAYGPRHTLARRRATSVATVSGLRVPCVCDSAREASAGLHFAGEPAVPRVGVASGG